MNTENQSAEEFAALGQACIDLARRLRAGESCRAESYLSSNPAFAARPEYALELIFTEFLVRKLLSQNPAPAEFYNRFPDWRERLQRLLQVDQIFTEHDRGL
jgi:hypothetical protein